MGDVAPGPEPGDESHQKSSLEGVTGSERQDDDFWFSSSRLARPTNFGGARRGIRGASSAMTSFTIALGDAGERRWPAVRAIRGSRVDGSICLEIAAESKASVDFL